MRTKSSLGWLSISAAFATLLTTAAPAQQISNAEYNHPVEIQVVPFAELEIIGSYLLYLLIPPSGSTVNAPSSVIFQVTGNAFASMTAEPDEFILIPPSVLDDGGYMGKAVLGANEIGYKLLLTFPKSAPFGCGCGPVKNASLPLDVPEGTEPLTVNLNLTGGVRQGAIDLLANPLWTTHGGLSAAGIYEGGIVLTVTADD
jgi:hypothetical protein